jgi:hypothetical protein
MQAGTPARDQDFSTRKAQALIFLTVLELLWTAAVTSIVPAPSLYFHISELTHADKERSGSKSCVL